MGRVLRSALVAFSIGAGSIMDGLVSCVVNLWSPAKGRGKKEFFREDLVKKALEERHMISRCLAINRGFFFVSIGSKDYFLT